MAMDSDSLIKNPAIQYLLQQADELTKIKFGSSTFVKNISEEQSLGSSTFTVGTATTSETSSSDGIRFDEVDQATSENISQLLESSLSASTPSSAFQQYEFVDVNNTINAAAETSSGVTTSLSNYGREIFRDPNPPQVIRRPAVQGPVTYRQNIAVRFLQPPPVPPPGPLIIKEVRAPQPPAPKPLVIRQCAPPLPTPPPLILREKPPQSPIPIPSQTVIKRLPPIPVPPRSVIIERYPPKPPRPRDIIIERWLPYSKEPQPRKVITHRAPPVRPYPTPRNAIIIYEPVQANVVRSIQRYGIQAQNPEEYKLRYGNTLLDTSTLIAQAQSLGITENLGPFASTHVEQYETNISDYLLNNAAAVFEQPQYEYTTSAWEAQTTSDNQNIQIYWTDPNESIPVILRRLGFTID